MLSCYLISVFAGIAMMVASLRHAFAILPIARGGPLDRMWQGLLLLLVVLISGCTINVWFRLRAPITTPELIVSVMVLAGGAVCLIVVHLSAIATRDIVRLTKLECEVMRDPLTGAYNRRYLEATLPMEVTSARRSQHPLSALLIDLDHFKQVNDTYGHPIGDIVLKQVCDLILRNSRSIDTVIRYGGEEFIVVSPGCDLDAMIVLGNRMLRQIAGHAITLPDGALLHVTASMGAASLGPTEDEVTFIARADQALYAAKRGGRNQLCIASIDAQPVAA